MCEALSPTLKKLHSQNKNPINFLKAAWIDIAPSWAVMAEPYSIRNKVLTMKAPTKQALILQYREEELLKLAQTIVSHIVQHIKIIAH